MKIPEDAKRVFQGILFDVYQWEQQLFDGTTETFERLKRAPTVQVIATKGNKILLADEEQPDGAGFYSLFGGRMEEGEEPLAAAQREFLEETGMISADWEHYRTYQPAKKIDWDWHIYIARDCKIIQSPQLDAGEKISILELSFDEFVEHVFSERFRGQEFALDLFRQKERGELPTLDQCLFSSHS